MSDPQSPIDELGVAEVMRGEEAQVVGVPALLRDGGLACLPGTHSKWVRVEGGRITGFTTHMTGEMFREPDPQLGFLWGGLTMGMLLSVPMIFAGIVLIVQAWRRKGAAN